MKAALIEDIRRRLTNLPQEAGPGTTVPALPAVEDVDWSVRMYRTFAEFMDYVRISKLS